MFDSIVLIQFKNKKQNKKLEFEVQHLMIFTYFFLWITFLMKSEKNYTEKRYALCAFLANFEQFAT